MLEFEDVELRFTDDALEAIAEEALERKVGARGLQIILEELMLDIMYRSPSQSDVTEMRHHARKWSTRTASRSCCSEGRIASERPLRTRRGSPVGVWRPQPRRFDRGAPFVSRTDPVGSKGRS